MKSAIEAGLLVNKATYDEVFGLCTTGQCTWEYHTLAICSQVEECDYLLNFDSRPPRVLIDEQDLPDSYGHQISNTSILHSQGQYFDGAESRRNATPVDTKTNLPDVAQIYLSYYDPCLSAGTDSGTSNSLWESRQAWKAHKATFKLCVQTRRSSFNASGIHTIVTSTNPDLLWLSETAQVGDEDSKSQHCTQIADESDRYCVQNHILRMIGGQLVRTLDIKGFAKSGILTDSQHDALWAPNLGSDILGLDPGLCAKNISRGIKAFERRTGNIAINLSNA